MAFLDIEAGFWGLRRQIESLLGRSLANSVLQQAGVNGGASFAESFIPRSDQEELDAFTTCLAAYQTAGFGHFEITSKDWPIGSICIRAQNSFEAWMVGQHNQTIDTPACAYTSGVLVGFVNIISNRQDIVCIEHSCQGKGDDHCEFELLPASDTSAHQVVALAPDPGLGRQLNLLEMLFERMPMGIAVLDREYRIQRYNPTWVDYSTRYAPTSAAPLAPGVSYFAHLPGTEATVMTLFERSLEGETIQQNSVRLESEGIVTYWDIVLAPLMENDKIAGILIVSVDATEREEAKQNLEQRVEDRTSELQVLLDVAATANRSLNLDEMLKTTLDLLVSLIDATRVGVMLKDEASGKLEARILRPAQTISSEDFVHITQVCETVVARNEPLYIMPDAEQGFLEPGALLPLRIYDRVLGVLVIIGSKGGRFSPEQQSLFESIADQLGVAIENARLYEQVEQAAVSMERSRLARDLHDAVTQTLFSASLIAEVLPKLWDKDQEEGKRRLEEIRQLTRGALSEMRTLLLELRPAVLIDTELGDLISHQVNAFIARTRVPVEYIRKGDCDPPHEVKIVFYRVVQEALNNIGKHANASTVIVTLSCQPDNFWLAIRDDGQGFVSEGISPDHLGLGIMKERADGIKAELFLESELNKGTTIRITWQGSKKEKINE